MEAKRSQPLSTLLYCLFPPPRPPLSVYSARRCPPRLSSQSQSHSLTSLEEEPPHHPRLSSSLSKRKRVPVSQARGTWPTALDKSLWSRQTTRLASSLRYLHAMPTPPLPLHPGRGDQGFSSLFFAVAVGGVFLLLLAAATLLLYLLHRRCAAPTYSQPALVAFLLLPLHPLSVFSAGCVSCEFFFILFLFLFLIFSFFFPPSSPAHHLHSPSNPQPTHSTQTHIHTRGTCCFWLALPC